MAQRISTFDDWTDSTDGRRIFASTHHKLRINKFDSFYADPRHSEIEFDESKGRKKWEKLLDVPNPGDV